MRLILVLAIMVVYINLSMAASDLQDDALGEENRSAEELDYLNVSNAMWSRFWEDLYFSSYILDEYTRGNITVDNAYNSIVSAFIMCDRSTAFLETISPPPKYEKLNDLTLSAMFSLQAYLWNLAKMYQAISIENWNLDKYEETGSKKYLEQADNYMIAKSQYYQATQSYFNQTVEYMEQARKERIKATEF